MQTQIDLIRHGEPVGGKRYRGRLDDPLSEKGWQQMWAAVGEHHPWDQIVCSSLSRCAEFAQQLGDRWQIPVAIEADLVEIGFGKWEGRTAADLYEEDPDQLLKFWQDPVRFHPPGAEPLEDFSTRIVTAWEGIVSQYQGKHLLLVGHAGQMRMVISHLLAIPFERMFRIQIENAGICRIVIDGEGDETLPRILSIGGGLS